MMTKTFLIAISTFVFFNPSAIAQEESQNRKQILVEKAVLKFTQEVELSAEKSGILDRLVVKEGHKVARGELVAVIRDKDARLQRDKASLEKEIADRESNNEIDVLHAKKSLQVATSELKRAEDTNRRVTNGVSQAELDRLMLTVERSKLELKQAQETIEIKKLMAQLKAKELELASEDLRQHQIASPLNGTIEVLNKHVGEWVEKAEPIVKIVGTDYLRVEGFVSIKDATKNLTGKKAIVKVNLESLKEKAFDGEVEFVGLVTNPVAKKLRVWVRIKNSDQRLRPGLGASIKIQLD